MFWASVFNTIKAKASEALLVKIKERQEELGDEKNLKIECIGIVLIDIIVIIKVHSPYIYRTYNISKNN